MRTKPRVVEYLMNYVIIYYLTEIKVTYGGSRELKKFTIEVPKFILRFRSF